MAGAEVTVKIVGFESVDRALAALLPRAVQVGMDGLEYEAQLILAEARELVPVLTTDLRESGYVGDPIEIGEGAALSIGYGDDVGLEVDYALQQHENLDYQHEEGKTAKFLEKPILDWTKDGPTRIARRIAAALRSV